MYFSKKQLMHLKRHLNKCDKTNQICDSIYFDSKVASKQQIFSSKLTNRAVQAKSRCFKVRRLMISILCNCETQPPASIG